MVRYLLLLWVATALAIDAPVYTVNFKEGTAAKTDVKLLNRMVADCQYYVIGSMKSISHNDLKFSAKAGDFTEGTVLTAIDVTNLNVSSEAKIFKSSGGINNGYVWFSIEFALRKHAKYQFKMWGRVPAGKKVLKRTGNCLGSK